MLPLGLLTAAQGHPMLVELKNGETLNGHLVQCDTYMNLTLKEVVQTSPDGDKFFRLPECYVRGNNVSSGNTEASKPFQCKISKTASRRHHLRELTLARLQVKYLRVPDEIVDIVKEQQASAQAQRGGHRGGRGEHGGGRGRGDRGRGGNRGGRGRGRGRGD
ncbi:hypothetical protein Q7P37_011453 [Cladosporium fusiforme]